MSTVSIVDRSNGYGLRRLFPIDFSTSVEQPFSLDISACNVNFIDSLFRAPEALKFECVSMSIQLLQPSEGV